ncbi:MAG: helix-turn-helix transcriptional regulator [Phycisphaerae bacterium]
MVKARLPVRTKRVPAREADPTREAGPARASAEPHRAPGGWTFLSNHSHVLICLARDPELRLRDVAAAVGITERAVQNIVADLEAGGVVERERVGRRNHYVVHRDVPLRHPVESHKTVGDLLRALEK